MALFRGKFLGLVMEERRILAAEVQVFGQRKRLRRAAEFTLPDDLSLDDPQRLGQELREFLRRHRFSARATIIGVPARWLLSKEKGFPPASPSSLAGMVRLEAERSFASDLDNMILDYANDPDSGSGNRVLLMGLPRHKTDQLVAMSVAAGLKAKALTPTSMILAADLRPDCSSCLMLFVRPDHVELGIRSGGRFGALRHLPVAVPANGEAERCAPTDWKQELADETRRVVALLPQEGDAAPGPLVVWDGVGLDPQNFQELGESLSLQTELSDGLSELGAVPSSGDQVEDGHRFAAAAGLALAGARAKGFPVNFLHSRLETRSKTRLGRRIALIAAASAALLAACAVIHADWRATEKELSVLRQRLKDVKPDIEAAMSVVQQVTLARGWTDRRPRFLDPLRELTLAFPAEERIWVTNLAIREDMRTVVSGKSADERTVLDVLDRMRSSPAFKGVKLLYMRDVNGTGRGVAFSMTLDFVNRE